MYNDSLDNDFDITKNHQGFVKPNYTEDTEKFYYDNELDYETQFTPLMKTHGSFISHYTHRNVISEHSIKYRVHQAVTTEYWHCDHASKKRVKKQKEDEPPTKKQKRNVTKDSKKIGCKAKFKKINFADGKIEVYYEWKHTGHDPTDNIEVANSKLPAYLKLWIEKKVAEGFDWKGIKNLIRLDPSCLERVSD